MRASTRVAVNTSVQYVRTFVSVIITLYTSRVVLANLGIEDYGIYSLIGGVVALLSFIQNNLSRTTQRYLSYYQGKEDNKMLIKIFNNSLCTQLGISIGLCGILAAITNPVFACINIPVEKIESAKWVYWLMVGSLFMNMQSTPYLAALIARENIVYSSVVQIVDAVLKIPIALSLIWISENKLEWYSAMSFLVIALNYFFYYIYCRVRYDECKHFSFNSFDWGLSKEMLSFMGWSVYGTGCVIGRTQGTAILLNKYFGTSINAAFGISNQVSGQINFLANALTTAINPQIIKAEGAGDRKKMFRLSEISCKFSFLLMSMISIPIVIYMPTILKLWLGKVPEYSSMFCSFIVIANQIDLMTLNLNTTNQAIGNVKVYSICINTIKILTLPVMLIVLKMGLGPKDVMIVYLVFEIICAVTRLIFLRISVGLSIKNYFYNVFLPIVPPLITNIIVCGIISQFLTDWLFLISCIISCLVTCLVTYFFGLKNDECAIINGILLKLKNKLHHI